MRSLRKCLKEGVGDWVKREVDGSKQSNGNGVIERCFTADESEKRCGIFVSREEQELRRKVEWTGGLDPYGMLDETDSVRGIPTYSDRWTGTFD